MPTGQPSSIPLTARRLIAQLRRRRACPKPAATSHSYRAAEIILNLKAHDNYRRLLTQYEQFDQANRAPAELQHGGEHTRQNMETPVHSASYLQYASSIDPVASIRGAWSGLEARWEAEKLRNERLRRDENEFLSTVCKLLHTAGFELLSEPHAEACTSKRSSTGFAVSVDWDSMDKGVFTRFDAYGDDQPYAGLTRPSVFADHCLLAVRGQCFRERRGWFLSDKVDEVIRRGFRHYVSLRIQERLQLAPSTTKDLVDDQLSEGSVGMQPNTHGSDSLASIRGMPLTLGKLLSKSTLREPCHESVLLLYRRAEIDDDCSFLNPQNIFIRHYRHVPVSDVELLMPEKQAALRATDQLTFGSLLVAAALSALPLAVMEEFTWPWMIAGATLVGAVTRISFRYRAVTLYYREAVSQQASRSTVSNDTAALQQLSSMAAAEQLKRAVVVHHCLENRVKTPESRPGRALSVARLSAACQYLMSELAAENPDAERLARDMWPAPSLWPATDVGDVVCQLDHLGLWKTVGAVGGAETEVRALLSSDVDPPSVWATLLDIQTAKVELKLLAEQDTQTSKD